MSMSKYIEAPEEFDGQGQGRMPAVGSLGRSLGRWVGLGLGLSVWGVVKSRW